MLSSQKAKLCSSKTSYDEAFKIMGFEGWKLKWRWKNQEKKKGAQKLGPCREEKMVSEKK